mgnify:CR=1 FL=1
MVNIVRKVESNQLVEGMILGAPIVDAEGTVELLSRGTKLTQRQIALISNMGVQDIFILDYDGEPFEQATLNVNSMSILRKSTSLEIYADSLTASTIFSFVTCIDILLCMLIVIEPGVPESE